MRQLEGEKKMSNGRVYLAGPITSLSYDETIGWREYAKLELEKYSIDGFSPMRAKAFLSNESSVKDSYEQSKIAVTTEQKALSTDLGITTRDRMDVMEADLVLVNLLDAKTVSIGTMIELGWADMSRTPVVLVMEDFGENIHEHGIVRAVSGLRVNTLEAGLTLIKAILLP